MKKVNLFIFSAIALFVLGSCGNTSFKKTRSGLMYKVVSDGKGIKGKKGDILKVHYTSKLRDSLLGTSYNGVPTYALVDSIGPVYTAAEIFPLLRKGDSAVVVMLADTLFKKNPESVPPFIKRKDKIVISFKVLDIIPNEEARRKDEEDEINKFKSKEVKVVEDYLAKNNIKAERAPKGTFVVVEKQGDGMQVDSGKMVSVMYTGKTFGGTVFDSNIDPKFQHPEPYSFVIGSQPPGAIEGWDDGLRLFKKGGKGKLYIPSMLGYAANPRPGGPIKPFDNLMFDVEVVDVKDAPKQDNTVAPPQGQPSDRRR